jgi:membrane-associated phospholipid phosphatase
MMSWWNGLSMLGSLPVTAPIGIAIAAWLLAGRSWRLSLSWCLLFGLGMLLVVATKIAWIGWGVGMPEMKFGGLSGHSMRACAVFPVAFYLAFHNAEERTRRFATAGGVVLALLVSASRVPVLAHSWSEVVLGAVVGLAVSAAFISIAHSPRPLQFGRVLAGVALPVLLVVPHAEPLPTERWMTRLALYLSGHEKPFERRW